jgi:hypothetical protein
MGPGVQSQRLFVALPDESTLKVVGATPALSADRRSACVKGLSLSVQIVYKLCVDAVLRAADGATLPSTAACTDFMLDASPPVVDAAVVTDAHPVPVVDVGWDLSRPSAAYCDWPTAFIDDMTPAPALHWRGEVVFVTLDTVLQSVEGTGSLPQLQVALGDLVAQSRLWGSGSVPRSLPLLQCRLTVSDAAMRTTRMLSSQLSAAALMPCTFTLGTVLVTSVGAAWRDGVNPRVVLPSGVDAGATVTLQSSELCLQRLRAPRRGSASDAADVTIAVDVCATVLPDGGVGVPLGATTAQLAAARQACIDGVSSSVVRVSAKLRVDDATSYTRQAHVVATVSAADLGSLVEAAGGVPTPPATSLQLVVFYADSVVGTSVFVSSPLSYVRAAPPSVVPAAAGDVPTAAVSVCDEGRSGGRSASVLDAWALCSVPLPETLLRTCKPSFAVAGPDDDADVDVVGVPGVSADGDGVALAVMPHRFADPVCGAECLLYRAWLTSADGTALLSCDGVALPTVESAAGLPFLRLPPVPWCVADTASKHILVHVVAVSTLSQLESDVVTRSVVILYTPPRLEVTSSALAVSFDAVADELKIDIPNFVDAAGGGPMLYSFSVGTTLGGTQLVTRSCLGEGVRAASVAAADALLTDGVRVFVTALAEDRAGQRSVLTATTVVRHAAPRPPLPAAMACGVRVAAPDADAAAVCAPLTAGTIGVAVARASLGSADTATVFGCWSTADAASFFTDETLSDDASNVLTTTMRVVRQGTGPADWLPLTEWLSTEADAGGVAHVHAAVSTTPGTLALEIKAVNAVRQATVARCPTSLFVGESCVCSSWWCSCAAAADAARCRCLYSRERLFTCTRTHTVLTQLPCVVASPPCAVDDPPAAEPAVWFAPPLVNAAPLKSPASLCITNTTSFTLSWTGMHDGSTPLPVQLSASLWLRNDARRSGVAGLADQPLLSDVQLPKQRGDVGSVTLRRLAELAVGDAAAVQRVRTLSSGSLLVGCLRATNAAGVSSPWTCTAPTIVADDTGLWTADATASLVCIRSSVA